MSGETYYLYRFTRDNAVYYNVMVVLHGEIGESDVANEILSTFKFTSAVSTTGWKTYTDPNYPLTLKYPVGWTPSTKGNVEVGGLTKDTPQESASIDIKAVQQETKFKTIIQQRTQVQVDGNIGYETIGTLCTKICTGSAQDIYTPFAVVEISHNNRTYEISYVEGVPGNGWATNIGDWKSYVEFLRILSTLTFTQ